MNYKIEYSSKAIKSIEEIYLYITFALSNQSAAHKTISGINITIEQLSFFPERNKITDDPLLSKKNVRFARYKNFLILYTIYESESIVTIIDVFYCKRDIKNAIKN